MSASSRIAPLSTLLFTALGLAQDLPPLHLIEYGSDLAQRDALIRTVPVYADLGRHVVARLAPAEAARLQPAAPTAFAEPLAGELLVAWSQPGDEALASGRLLLAGPGFSLSAVAAGWSRAAEPGRGLHGGWQVVDLSRPYVPTPDVPSWAPTAVDPRVAALVAQVQEANLTSDVTALSAIFTRRTSQPENAQAVALVTSRLQGLGLTYATTTFNAAYGPNVVAELPGTDLAQEIVMVGAHLDSLAGSTTTRAPGADDNASGSAAVLEIARVFATHTFRRTLRFGWWNAEELGLLGSNAYATAAATRGDRIVAYVNIDMNAYRASGDGYDVDYISNDSTPALITLLSAATTTYVPTLGVNVASLSGGTSDHRSFFRAGFPAAFPFEDVPSYSPYIHTTNDVVGTSANDFVLARRITQSVVAGLATLAEPVPDAPVFTLDVTGGPTVGGTAVVATGSDLDVATALRVGGRSVPFTVLTGTTLGFETPPSTVAGPVDVVVSNAGGDGRAPFTYAVTNPPALRLPATLGRGATGNVAIGGPPGFVEATFLSPLLGITDLVLVRLDIGGGSASALFFVASAGLSPSGGLAEHALLVPNEASLVGAGFHFQAVVVDPALTSFVATNHATLVIQ